MNTNSTSLLSRNEIPIVDLELKGSTTSPPQSWFLEKGKLIHHALVTKGFVFLINHGIATKRFQTVHQIMDTFCSLPDEVKTQYTVKPPERIQGYVPPGSEQLYNKSKLELRHGYNIQNFKEKLPLEEIPDFKEVVEGVAQEFLELSKLLLTVIAVNLDLDPEKVLNVHKGMMKENNLTTLRMLYYPPLGNQQLDNVTRCGEHCDWGTFTLLAQDSEGGLEIFDGGEWSRVGHLPDALLMNVADTLGNWTCKLYKSAKHRVVVPESVELQAKPRHGIAFFVLPDNNTSVDSSFLARCRDEEQVKEPMTNGQAKNVNILQYVQQKLIEAFKEAKI